MMQVVVAGALGQSFRKGVNEQAYRLALWQHREHQNRDRKEKEADGRESVEGFVDLAVTAVTAEQAGTFQAGLDIYQVATIEALEANNEAAEQAQDRLNQIIDRAYILEDGRRVFKTEDGRQVFDENGAELQSDVISPDDIPDYHPRWETAKAALDDVENLRIQRQQILDFQDELDKAQALLDSGNMTQAQFDERQAYLKDNAPDAVKRYAEGIKFDKTDTPISGTENASIEIDLDADLSSAVLPTAMAPAPGAGS